MPCFHVGCTTGYSKNYTKCHLFKLKKSASEDIKRQWIKNIPKRKHIEFDVNRSSLCDLHFDSKFIIKHYVIHYGDRVEIQGERKNWTLTNDAVPTIFQNHHVSPIYNRPLLKRKAPTERSVIPKKLFKMVPNNTSDSETTTEVPSTPSSIYDDTEKIQLPNQWHLVSSGKDIQAISIYKFGPISANNSIDIVKSVEVSLFMMFIYMMIFMIH